jgi:hypothetical protein
MEQPDALIGAPDQHTFDMLWGANQLGVREKTALLPANAVGPLQVESSVYPTLERRLVTLPLSL